MTRTESHLWVEKWAPSTVEDLILRKEIKDFFLSVEKEGALNQNLILLGTQGCGKTQTIKTLTEITGQDVLFLNGSSEGRYLDTIRTQVLGFGTSMSMFSDKKKVIFFDEFDGTTKDVMLCLRGVIEQLQDNVSFIFTCNNIHKIIEPIQSRCVSLKYTPIPKSDKARMMGETFKRMLHILKSEGIEFNKQTVADLVAKSFPDTRKLINTLQRYSSISKRIDSEIISSIEDTSLDSLIESLSKKNYANVRKWVSDNYDNDPSILLKQIYEALTSKIKNTSIPAAVLIINKYQYQSAFVGDQEINLLAAMTELMIECEFN